MNFRKFWDVFRTRAVSTGDENPAVWLPFEWVDADGMYSGQDGAWLYFSCPDVFLHDDAALGRFLTGLANKLPGREIHLELQAWRDVPDIPDGDTPLLADFQRQAVSGAAPSIGAVFGIKLEASSTPENAGVGQEILAALDGPLGEDVPEFETYTADREEVTAAVTQLGARPLSARAADFLENWFTRGRIQDVEAVERDDILVLDTGNRYVEVAAAGTLIDDEQAGMLPEFDLDGAAVISIRGTIALSEEAEGQRQGVVMRASVIYGRMSAVFYQALPSALLSLPGVAARPLPLRQIAGLQETLPCATQRLAPEHQRLNAKRLRALGFTAQEKPGAERGLLVGKGGRVSPNVFYLDPWEGTGVTGLFGDPGSGKTVLCELLATQSYLTGVPTVYFSSQIGAGYGFQGLAGVAQKEVTPGMWGSPYQTLPSPLRERFGAAMLLAAGRDAGLNYAELEMVSQAGAHAQRVQVETWEAQMRLVQDPRVQAKLMRFWGKEPGYAALLAGNGGSGQIDTNVVADVSGVSANSPVLAGVYASAIYQYAASTATPALFVLDEVPGAVLREPVFQQLLHDVAQLSHVAVVMSSGEPEALGAGLELVTQRFMFADKDRQRAPVVLPELGAEEHGWLDEGAPQVTAGQIVRHAGGVYRAPSGLMYRFQVGLLPQKGQQVLLRLGQ